MMQQTIRVFPQQHGRSVPSHLRSAFKADAFRINSVEVIGERPTIGRLPRAFISSTNETIFVFKREFSVAFVPSLSWYIMYIIVFDKEVVENGEPKNNKKSASFSHLQNRSKRA